MIPIHWSDTQHKTQIMPFNTASLKKKYTRVILL